MKNLNQSSQQSKDFTTKDCFTSQEENFTIGQYDQNNNSIFQERPKKESLTLQICDVEGLNSKNLALYITYGKDFFTRLNLTNSRVQKIPLCEAQSIEFMLSSNSDGKRQKIGPVSIKIADITCEKKAFKVTDSVSISLAAIETLDSYQSFECEEKPLEAVPRMESQKKKPLEFDNKENITNLESINLQLAQKVEVTRMKVGEEKESP